MQEIHGPLSRTYWLSSHVASPSRVEICLDASPWGRGAFLAMDGTITEWFSSSLSDEELAALQIQRGGCQGQQALEALCALVALRTWSSKWTGRRLQVRIQSDSVSALILATRLKTHGTACGIIAREMTLDLAMSTYQPLVATHIPGIANGICDELSRRFQPRHQLVLCACWLPPP